MEIDMVDNATLGTIIKVVGVGGAGGNAVQHMINKGVSGVEFIAANTDAQALHRSSAGTLVQLGQTGLGAGSKPDKGRESAQEAVEKIKLLQSDPELAERIARNGQEFAQSRYSFARVGQALATEIQREMRPWQPPSAFTRFWVKLRYGMKVPV